MNHLVYISAAQLIVSALMPAPAAEPPATFSMASRVLPAPQSLEISASVTEVPVARDDYKATPKLELEVPELDALAHDFTTQEEFEASVRDELVTLALSYEGVPYVFGGSTPAGWDCSGFALWVTRAVTDIEFTHGVGHIVRSPDVHEVTKDEAKPGDFVVYSKPDQVNYHMGIYLGNDEMVHAPRTGDVTKVSPVRYSENAVQFFSLKLGS